MQMNEWLQHCHDLGLHPRQRWHDSYHEMTPEHEDVNLGCALSGVLGDTFLDCDKDSPRDQWIRVAMILRLRGLKIVDR